MRITQTLLVGRLLLDILVPRGRVPFGQHQESRPLAGPSHFFFFFFFLHA